MRYDASVDDELVALTEPTGELTGEMTPQTGVIGGDPAERRLGHDRDDACVAGDHGRRSARRGVDQRHLTNVVACSARGNLAPVDDDVNASGQDERHVEVVAVLGEQDLTFGDLGNGDDVGKCVGERRIAAQQRLVGQCSHEPSPAVRAYEPGAHEIVQVYVE
jgi:hypothetical protein